MNPLDLNTVPAYRQLREDQICFTFDDQGTGHRVLFLGNSITLHGIAPHLGWNRLCGMAASAVENDYVHLCRAGILAKHPDACFQIAQVSEWERRFREGQETYPLYASAREFDADVIIVRFLENCPSRDFDHETFRAQARALLDYFNPSGTAKFLFTSSFWRHPGDEDMKALAEEYGCPFVSLSDLGDLDEMMAIGQYEHTGVARHPGDLGMKTIAGRILEALDKNGIL
ncbi:MAG: SGNH/GDSL hydrolase family protein [Ruminococcaceae bacterium]|nr:SGNH/GDSL hydrolase family protein [Oscillospiraceae bacterium]